MKKLLLILSLIIITTDAYSNQIMNELCKGDPNCTICADFTNNDFQVCTDKFVFNPNYIKETDDEIIKGQLSTTVKDKFCTLPNKEVACQSHTINHEDIRMKSFAINERITSEKIYNKNFPPVISGVLRCNRSQCLEEVKVATDSTSAGGGQLVDIDYDTGLCTYYTYLGDTYESYKTERCSTKTQVRRIIFNTNSITQDKWNDKYMYIEADNNGDLNYKKLPIPLLFGFYNENLVYNTLGSSVLAHKWSGKDYKYDYQKREFTYNYNLNIRVPMDIRINSNNYTCPNARYPCTMKSNGSYYCTPTPCSVLTTDGNLTETDKKPESLTPEYEDATNNGCKPDQNIYIFTPVGGKHKECREKAVHVGGNDLTSPNQCVKQDNLSNEAKESLLGGLNKTFDAIKKVLDPSSELLGDLSMLVNPAAFVLKAYELIGEAIIRNLAEEPTQEEKDLSLLRASYAEDGACHKIGDYCSYYNMDGMYGEWADGTKWDLTSCGRRSSLYCCYDSPIAKAFNKAAREQLPGFTWGENLVASNIQSNYKQPKPDCRGLTIEELSKINIDDPKFADEMKAYVNDVLMPELTGPSGMLDISRLTETSKKMADDIQSYYK